MSSISFKCLIDNIKVSKLDKIILTLTFTFSFWLIYIFEIEAISHLAAIPIFLIIISELNKFDKFENFDTKYIIYFGILNCGLFFDLSQLFCVSSIICGIYFLVIFSKVIKRITF